MNSEWKNMPLSEKMRCEIAMASCYASEVAKLETRNDELLDALQTYINIPIMADPGHEQELIDAINKATEAIRKAKEK